MLKVIGIVIVVIVISYHLYSSLEVQKVPNEVDTGIDSFGLQQAFPLQNLFIKQFQSEKTLIWSFFARKKAS